MYPSVLDLSDDAFERYSVAQLLDLYRYAAKKQSLLSMELTIDDLDETPEPETTDDDDGPHEEDEDPMAHAAAGEEAQVNSLSCTGVSFADEDDSSNVAEDVDVEADRASSEGRLEAEGRLEEHKEGSRALPQIGYETQEVYAKKVDWDIDFRRSLLIWLTQRGQ